jgi:multidrug resistance efflux pump
LKSGEELLAKGGNAISQREVTRRRNTERSAQARLEEARARIVQLEEELKLIAAPNGATLAVDEAAVEQARRMLETAEIDLGLLDVRAPINATVLQVNVRPGEFAFAGTVVTPLIILGNLDPLHVRVDIDEGDVSRFSPAATAYASLRGQPNERMQLKFVRVEPIIVPKRSLTGAAGERVDTRVLRVIYALPSDSGQAFSGQQVDVFIESVGRRAQVSQSAP